MADEATMDFTRTIRRTNFTSSLFPNLIDFKNPFLTQQLITCIGNKRQLLPFINQGIQKVKHRLGKEKIVTLDGFSGSGVVARLLKYHSSELWVNDLEDYCEVLNQCYLANRSEINPQYVSHWMAWINNNKLNAAHAPGYLEKNYAPKDDNRIRPGERVFYTKNNARIIDNIRTLIDKKIERKYQHFFIAPLIVEASIHANTSGVFKGFHKKKGVGHFGGQGENALTRIKGEISLLKPILCESDCKVFINKENINKLIRARNIPNFDLVYYDPPYNQHPYGSNYFMLNIIARNHLGKIQDGVSGIAKDWNRSDYNKKQAAFAAMDNLIKNTFAKFILLSYNNEGIIHFDEMMKLLKSYGKLEVLEKDYNTYRGSRNLRSRPLKVKELLWVLEKK